MIYTSRGRTFLEDLQDVQEIDTADALVAALKQGYHPGAILVRLLRVLRIRESELADEIGLSRAMISQIISNNKRVTPGTALRLSVFFHRHNVETTAEDWALAQLRADLDEAVEKNLERQVQDQTVAAA